MAFTLIGCQVSLEMGHSLLIAAISGVITGVFGGILRDILCNDVPLIFRRELYASVSFASAWCYLICVELELPSEQAMLITLFSGFLFRLLAIRFHWEMPKFVYQTISTTEASACPLADAFLQPLACPRCHGLATRLSAPRPGLSQAAARLSPAGAGGWCPEPEPLARSVPGPCRYRPGRR